MKKEDKNKKVELNDNDLNNVSGGSSMSASAISDPIKPKFHVGQEVTYRGLWARWDVVVVSISSERKATKNWPREDGLQWYYTVKYTGWVGRNVGSKTEEVAEYELY